MVRSFFESSIMSWTATSEDGTQSKHPFGYLLPESECQLKGINTTDEREDEFEIICQSGHIWSWFRLLSMAGIGEGSGVEARSAAAKSLLASKALFWCTRSSVDGIKQSSEDHSKGGGDFACRLWMLTLQMLQVYIRIG